MPYFIPVELGDIVEVISEVHIKAHPNLKHLPFKIVEIEYMDESRPHIALATILSPIAVGSFTALMFNDKLERYTAGNIPEYLENPSIKDLPKLYEMEQVDALEVSDHVPERNIIEFKPTIVSF